VETTSGPLGEGLAQGTGMALAAKLDKKDWRVYVVTSDAEHQCGLHWEAVMTRQNLNSITLSALSIATSFNRRQYEDIMPLEPLADKYRSFNWNVLECDGNDIAAFIETVEKAKAQRENQA